ncbi:MAG: amino acid adenylation domain-containing protein, partial [Lachnospiraceae bacterium]|nr:amino acid adenylation domain-containing protein [Lachnospiraceae bacterium]
MQRRSIFFTALFGILKAGAAFIPCDPAYPDERIRQIAMDSGASMILTSTDRAASLVDGWDYAGKVLTDDKLISDGPCDSAPEVSVNPEDLAYLIYTSGSTGKPKGVELTHAGICNYLDPDPANIHVHILATKTRTTLSVTTVSFDMSFKETLTTLCNGKTLVFADEDQANDPAALTALFEKTGADCFNATPSRLQQYMEYEPFARALSGCRLIMAGGEQYPLSLLKKLKGLAKEGTKIVNTYGPTEITVSCNGALLNGADKVTVGRPLLNVKEYIMDAGGHLMPPYCTGELYIGGKGVARGYRNLPEATAKSFVEFEGERFYRSGDLARWDEKGNVVILGRIDSQIKLRGLRIELGEIEGAIEDYSGIRKAVAAVKKLAGQDQLCAYYTSDSEIDINDLKESLKKRLTFYMIPVSFMRLSEIPVTHNGKTDVKALPDPVIKAGNYRKPETKDQELIYDLIKEVTGIDGFGIDTDFEQIGLSSLTMVGLTLKISSLFGKPLKFSDIKENPTVEKLAAHIINLQKNEDHELKKIYPLTMTQTGIYVECMANPGTTIYNIPLLYELTNDIDLARLKEAIITAVDAHPFLKGRIMEGEDGVYVKRQDDRELSVEIEEIKGEADFASLVRPYDLLKDDLARFRILIYPDKKYLYMDLHHIAADGQSRRILERDISRAYLGETIDKEEYSGYEVALSEDKDRKGPTYDKAKDHYGKLLKDADKETVPPYMPQGTEQKAIHLSRKTALTLDETESFCKAHHTTANGFFNAVFGYVLSVFSYSEESVFTTVYNGRNDARMADTVTMLVKTLPARVCINNDISPARLVKETGDELLSNMENDIFSFGEISRAYDIKGRIRVIYQGPAPGGGDGEWEEADFCGRRIRRRHLNLGTPKSDLTVEIFARESGIEFIAEYDSSKYCSEWAASFLATMEKVSYEFLNREKLSDVELMYEGGPDYYARSNDTDYKVEYVSVNRLFEAQA